MAEAAREAWITGIGILSCLGEGAQAHWQKLMQAQPNADTTTFAPFVVHPLAPVNFALDRLETNPRFAAIARPANAAILVKLRIDMEDRGGRTELLLPYATLEPIRKLLLQQFMGEKFGRDSIWEGHLATELWSTRVEIDAILDEQIMSLNKIMNLKVGDTIMLNANPDSKIEMRCGGVPLLRGRMGRVGSAVSVRVDEAVQRTDASKGL